MLEVDDLHSAYGRIEVLKGTEPQLKLTALNADVKGKLADDLF